MAYAADDASKTFSIRPAEASDWLKFDSTAKKFSANSSVAAGGNQTVRFQVTDGNAVVSPGDYNIAVELFTPAA